MLPITANAGAGDSGAAGISHQSGKSPLNSPSAAVRQPIYAELSGGDKCSALGITAHGTSPILALCRLLIGARYDPSRPLHAYRGEILCLRVRSIGEAARLEVTPKGTGFVRRLAVRPAPPVRQNLRRVRP